MFVDINFLHSKLTCLRNSLSFYIELDIHVRKMQYLVVWGFFQSREFKVRRLSYQLFPPRTTINMHLSNSFPQNHFKFTTGRVTTSAQLFRVLIVVGSKKLESTCQLFERIIFCYYQKPN